MQMKQSSRGRKFFEQLWRKMKKREKARRLRSGKYSPNYLRGKITLLKVSLWPQRTVWVPQEEYKQCSLWTALQLCLLSLLAPSLHSDDSKFFVATCTPPAAAGLCRFFFHAVSSHWNDISLLPFTLKDSVQELLPLGRVPRSSGPSLMLPQHLAFLPPTALMIVKISDWVPTFPLGYHQLLQGSIMCYSSLHSQILAQCFVLCRCTISTCYTVI